MERRKYRNANYVDTHVPLEFRTNLQTLQRPETRLTVMGHALPIIPSILYYLLHSCAICKDKQLFQEANLRVFKAQKLSLRNFWVC